MRFVAHYAGSSINILMADCGYAALPVHMGAKLRKHFSSQCAMPSPTNISASNMMHNVNDVHAHKSQCLFSNIIFNPNIL